MSKHSFVVTVTLDKEYSNEEPRQVANQVRIALSANGWVKKVTVTPVGEK